MESGGAGRFKWARTAGIVLATILSLGGPICPTDADQRAHGDVRLCAQVPDPGAPEGVVIAPDRTIYTGTANDEGNGRTDQRSKVFAYSPRLNADLAAPGPSCKLVRSYEITGQDLEQSHGLGGMAMDGEGRIYVSDIAPPRVLRIDPRTGRQEVYATVRDVPSCVTTSGTQCEPGQDFRTIPDFLAFGPDGSLYVTDAAQGLIWRIPKGGGRGSVWFSDPRIDPDQDAPFYGPVGIRLMPDGHRLMFVTLFQPSSCGSTSGAPCDVTAGHIWALPIKPDGRPGTLASFWSSQSFDDPIDVAFGRSGKVYVSLGGPSQIAVLSPNGAEVEPRFPSLVTNQLLKPPMDTPEQLAFEGKRLIVSNNSFTVHEPDNWALLDVYIGESGVPILRPRVDPVRPTRRIALSVNPASAHAGQETEFRFLASYLADGKQRPVAGARVRFAGTIAHTDIRGLATITKRFTRQQTLRPHACKSGFRCGRTSVRVTN